MHLCFQEEMLYIHFIKVDTLKLYTTQIFSHRTRSYGASVRSSNKNEIEKFLNALYFM